MSVQHESILSCLRHWAEVVPEKLAFGILDGDGALTARLSYRELALRSLKVSEWLGQRVAAGERVALVLPTSIEFVLAYYGCLAAGVMPVPLSGPNRRSGVGHLRAILQDCDAKLCLCDGDRAGKLAAALQEAQVSVPVIAFGPELYDQCQPATPNLPDPAQTAFLQYTSGSTSQPKGVMVGHRNIMANSAMIASVLGHDHDSVQVNWMPLFHDMGLVNHVLQPVFNGNSSLLMEPALFVQRPRLWLEAITRYRVTSTGGPSFCYGADLTLTWFSGN